MASAFVAPFVLGAVGALAPEIVRLWKIRSEPQRFAWSWFYLIVSMLFACLGGIVAVLLPSENARAAFYAGISTPVLVNTAAKNINAARRKRKKTLKGAASSVEVPLSPFETFIDAL
jgi:hypothetical protein